MSQYQTGFIDPGEGASRWSKGDAVTTDPDSPDFLDQQTFDVMLEAGKIATEAAKPKARKTKRKKGEDDASGRD